MTLDPRGTAELLLAFLAGRRDAADSLASLAPEEIASLARLCSDCDVAPWVHARLEDPGWPPAIAAELRGQLAPIRARVRRDNLLLIACAEQAIDRLLAEGIVPLALKGLDLLHRVYESFDLRTIDDVDLLLRVDELPRALEVLRSAGWRIPSAAGLAHFARSSHHLPIDSPGPISVAFELHWNLAQERRFRVDVAGLFERAVPVEIGGRRILRLADVDLVAHLLLHHFTHYFDRRIKWAIDLSLVTRDPEFDWEGVGERLEEWGATAVAGASAIHLRKLLPELIPERLLQRLSLAPWRRLLLAPLRSPHPLDLLRGTRRRAIQLYIAAVLLEQPRELPSWVLHRARRDRRPTGHPLDAAAPGTGDGRDRPPHPRP